MLRNARIVSVVTCLTLCVGSRSARAQEAMSKSVCVEETVIRQCEKDALEADRLRGSDARAKKCQRQLDTTDGSLQQCQLQMQRLDERFALRLDVVTREAARVTVERDDRPEWVHVAMVVAGTLVVGFGTGYILGGL